VQIDDRCVGKFVFLVAGWLPGCLAAWRTLLRGDVALQSTPPTQASTTAREADKVRSREEGGTSHHQSLSIITVELAAMYVASMHQKRCLFNDTKQIINFSADNISYV
jgi:hypothetical protein